MTPNPTIEDLEWRRLKELSAFEDAARARGFSRIAGVDEAGRGPLAGPVLAAACLLPPDLFIPGVDDSKKLSAKKRERLFSEIVSQERIVYSIACVDADEIDRINIYQATVQAMLMAVDSLEKTPDYLLVDGLKLPHAKIPSLKIPQGDARSHSIACASILAKCKRDQIMLDIHQQYPEYGFDTHKGYGTKKHLEALKKFGPTPYHRKTFRHVMS